MAEDAGRGWRRVVASPEPVEVVESPEIQRLLDAGEIVVACGGGGVPVARVGDELVGVDAVIDKDFAAALIGRLVGATSLLLLTGVERVALDFGTPRERGRRADDRRRGARPPGRGPVPRREHGAEGGGRGPVHRGRRPGGGHHLARARRRRPGRAAPAPASSREPPVGAHLAPARRRREVPAASARARALLEDPQGFGNYMTYRDAYRILGWDPADVYRDGAIALDRREWADLGWMANHIGPSPRALDAMRAAVDAEHVGPYSPDLDEGLRDLMAEALLGRPRDDGFDVIGTEGAQAGVGYAALACLDPGDEVDRHRPRLLPLRPGAAPGRRRAGLGAPGPRQRLAPRPRRGRRRAHAAHQDGRRLRPGEPVRDGPAPRRARGPLPPVGRARHRDPRRHHPLGPPR